MNAYMHEWPSKYVANMYWLQYAQYQRNTVNTCWNNQYGFISVRWLSTSPAHTHTHMYNRNFCHYFVLQKWSDIMNIFALYF